MRVLGFKIFSIYMGECTWG